MAESGGRGSARGKKETQGLNLSPLGNLMVTYFERRVSSLIDRIKGPVLDLLFVKCL